METKKCSKCKEYKLKMQFAKYNRRTDGLQNSCKECARNQSSKWYYMNKMKAKGKLLKRKYGISLDEYEELFNSQYGICAICNRKETVNSNKGATVKKLAVDHCHKTGKIRGLLCHFCNTAIGAFQDDTDLLEKAISYIKKHKQG